jgi:hypothetical protein
MRAVLVMAAILTGLPLLCLGILGTTKGCMMSHPEPESGNRIAWYGTLAVPFGSLLCHAPSMCSKHHNKEQTVKCSIPFGLWGT